MIPDLASDASRYCRLGWPLVLLHGCSKKGCTCKAGAECSTPGKHPRYPKWDQRASSDYETIREQFAKHPNSNLGVLLGPASGLVDVEFDDEEGRLAAEELLAEVRTPTYESSRSIHRLFRLPDLSFPTAVVKVRGLEIRTGAGDKATQSVLPPSRHGSGVIYRWLPGLAPEDCEPAPLPESILRALREPSRPLDTADDHSAEYLMTDDDLATAPGVAEGSRRQTLLSLVGVHLARHGATSDVQRLALAWGQRCTPAMPEKEVNSVVGALLGKHGSKPAADRLRLRPVSAVKPEPTRFIFGNQFLYGGVSILAGEGGLGKSTLMLDLAARLSRGESPPFSAKIHEPNDCIIVAAEDSAGVIYNRLRAAEADLDRIHLLEEDEVFDSFRTDTDRLINAVNDRKAKLVVFDGVADFAGDIDDSNNTRVRQALRPIGQAARSMGLAIVGLSHLNKKSESSRNRLIGSVAWVNLTRSLSYLVQHPDDDSRRILLHEKCNNSQPDPCYSFRIEPIPILQCDGSTQCFPRILWDPEPAEISRDELRALLAAGNAPKAATWRPTAKDRAATFLRESLPPGEERDAGDLEAKAKAEGIGRSTLQEMANQLGVVKVRGCWTLPDDSDVSED